MSDAVETLVAYCRENNRVCPLPPLWNRLWEMLPNRTRVGAGWQPPLPLILAAWHDTPAMLKMLRLAEHIEWAAQYGALESVARFLRELREEDWFHIQCLPFPCAVAAQRQGARAGVDRVSGAGQPASN